MLYFSSLDYLTIPKQSILAANYSSPEWVSSPWYAWALLTRSSRVSASSRPPRKTLTCGFHFEDDYFEDDFVEGDFVEGDLQPAPPKDTVDEDLAVVWQRRVDELSHVHEVSGREK